MSSKDRKIFPIFFMANNNQVKGMPGWDWGGQSIRHITTDLLWIRKSNPIIFCTYSSSRHSASPLSLSPHSLSCYFMYWGTVLQLWCSLSRTKVRRGQTRSTASQQKPINPPMLFSFIIIIMNPQ